MRYPMPDGGRRAYEAVPGGESALAFRYRVDLFWSRLTCNCVEGERILLVAHGGTISMLFHAFLELPVGSNVGLLTSDTGLHLWRIEGSRRTVLFANSPAHLAGDSAPTVA